MAISPMTDPTPMAAMSDAEWQAGSPAFEEARQAYERWWNELPNTGNPHGVSMGTGQLAFLAGVMWALPHSRLARRSPTPEGWVLAAGTWRGDVASYLLHYGSRCRDCADEDGVCPASGLPCEVPAALKAVEHVLAAITYGVRQGFLSAAPASPAPGGGWRPPLDGSDCLASSSGEVWFQAAYDDREGGRWWTFNLLHEADRKKHGEDEVFQPKFFAPLPTIEGAS